MVFEINRFIDGRHIWRPYICSVYSIIRIIGIQRQHSFLQERTVSARKFVITPNTFKAILYQEQEVKDAKK